MPGDIGEPVSDDEILEDDEESDGVGGRATFGAQRGAAAGLCVDERS